MAHKFTTPPRYDISDDDSELSDSPSLPEFKEFETSSNKPQAAQAPSPPKDESMIMRSLPRQSYLEPESDADDDDIANSTTKKGKGKAKAVEPVIPKPNLRKRKEPTTTPRNWKRKKTAPYRRAAIEQENIDIERVQLERLAPGVAIEKTDLKAHAEQSLAKFERNPTEILQHIASILSTDVDLVRLSRVSPSFLVAILPQNSPIWRDRFLAQYDHPLIDNSNQFCAAYKERALVLSNFTSFGDGSDARLDLQLAVVHDMVLETFYPSKLGLPLPSTSKNLSLFSTTDSKWMVTLMSNPVFNTSKLFGEPHVLFDTLQVTLSHLLLSPTAKMAKIISFGRDDYDIAKVYNWNAAFGTIYTFLSTKPIPDLAPGSAKGYLTFSPAKVIKKSGFAIRARIMKLFRLDINTLLNIRNFWHRHMIRDQMKEQMKMDLGEDTFHRTAEKLAELGHIPKAWSKSLLPSPAPGRHGSSTMHGLTINMNPALPQPVNSLMPNSKWVGFHSRLLKWPSIGGSVKTTYKALVEQQTDTETSNSFDPLVLDLSFKSTNREIINLPERNKMTDELRHHLFGTLGDPQADSSLFKAFMIEEQHGEECLIWPDIFASIPIFLRTIPTPEESKCLEDLGDGKTWYLKGIAPIMNIDDLYAEKCKKKRSKAKKAQLSKAYSSPSSDADTGNFGSDSDSETEKHRKGRGKGAGKTAPGGSLRLSSQDDIIGDGKCPAPKLSRFHPFTAMRVRGIVHPIPWKHPATFSMKDRAAQGTSSSTASAWPPFKMDPPVPVPGFKRLVMVLYKPELMGLILQLENDLRCSGGNYGRDLATALSEDEQKVIASAMGWNGNGNNNNNDNDNTAGANGIVNGNGAAPAGAAADPTDPFFTQADDGDDQGSSLPSRADALNKYLALLVREKTNELSASAAPTPAPTSPSTARTTPKPKTTTSEMEALWTRDLILDLEATQYEEGQLSWDDIELAYAYEGVITPGGEIMLGRYWRIGLEGFYFNTMGAEVDFNGEPVYDLWQDNEVPLPPDSASTMAGPSMPTAPTVPDIGPDGESSFNLHQLDADAAVAAAAAAAAAAAGANGAAAAPASSPGRYPGLENLERGPFVFWTMNEESSDDGADQ